MNQQMKISDVNDIIKEKIAENRAKVDKLDAVKGLLPKELIEEKQLIILGIVFALQAVQVEVLNFLNERINDSRDNNEDHKYITPEQKARDLLERMEVPNAQDYTSGELVELANLFVDQ